VLKLTDSWKCVPSICVGLDVPVRGECVGWFGRQLHGEEFRWNSMQLHHWRKEGRKACACCDFETCLQEKATKWHENGQIDGLTTNGVLVMHPRGSFCGGEAKCGMWREVSVEGGVFSVRGPRSSQRKGVAVSVLAVPASANATSVFLKAYSDAFFRRTPRPAVPNLRARPKSGSRGVWLRVAKRFYAEFYNYAELYNYDKIKVCVEIQTEWSRNCDYWICVY
jgi:hypothetical protein